MHRKLQAVENTTPVYKIEKKSEEIVRKVMPPITASPSISKHPYLVKDIKKTGIVTASIVGLQIVLFLILKFHVISIPGIIY
mgnify:FL=1